MMKNIFKPLLVLFSVVAVSCSTDDVENRPIIEAIDAPQLTAPSNGNIYTLRVEDKDKLADRFVWSSANFGGNVEITYSLQMDMSGNDFSNAEVLGSVNSENQLGVTVETLNGAALALGAEPFSAQAYDVRVKASVGSEMDMFSEIATMTISAYTTESPKIYVVGGFLGASGYGNDWTPADAVPLAASAFGETDFEGFVYMANAGSEYKFLPSNGSFDGDYGDAGSSNGSYTNVLKQDGEVNCGTPDGTGGYYFVKADTEALTYSLEKTAWSVTGNATPRSWPAGPGGTPGQDHDLTYDPIMKTWSVVLDLTKQDAPDNGLKFRANDDWALNLGDNGADGSLEFNGTNISVPEDGNYTITLDLSNPRGYTYSLVKN